MRPLGRPPTPSATSSAIDPVGITEIGCRASSPRRITEPLPKVLSICANASSSALSRSCACAAIVVPFSNLVRRSEVYGRAGYRQLRRREHRHHPRRGARPPENGRELPIDSSIGEHLFESNVLGRDTPTSSRHRRLGGPSNSTHTSSHGLAAARSP